MTDPMGLLKSTGSLTLDQWLEPKMPPGNCATAECVAGILPTSKANPTACEMQCGIGSDDAAARAMVCKVASEAGKLLGLPGIPVTLACKAIDKYACIKSCEEQSQCK